MNMRKCVADAGNACYNTDIQSGVLIPVCHGTAVRAPAVPPTIDRQKQIWQAPRCLPDLLKDLHKLRWRKTKREVCRKRAGVCRFQTLTS